MESSRGEDEKKGVREELCGEEARRRGGELGREGELGRAVATKRTGELWQGGGDKSCDKKKRIEGEP